MPTDPIATPEPAEDPTEDTLSDGQDGDTAPDTQDAPQPSDWEARYKELQKHAKRVEQENAILRRGSPAAEADEDEEEDEAPEPQPRESDPRYMAESWQLASALYGDEAIDAYNKAHPLFERAQTPADYIAALEAYHQARAGGAKPKEAARKAAPATGPAAPVDSNRPDAGPDTTDIDRKAEAARASGDSRGWFQAQLERMGVGKQ